MPTAQLPDGVEIHWDQRGEGPLVVISNQFFSEAWVFEGLIALLAEDHRVVTYDPRGTGRSSRQRAVRRSRRMRTTSWRSWRPSGPPAVVVGHGRRLEPRRARGGRAARPDRRGGVRGAATRRASAVEGTDGLAGSESVLEALMSMMETDYRGALRTMIGTANPGFDEETLRMRVNSTCENCPQDVAAERMRSWIADDATGAGAGARATGCGCSSPGATRGSRSRSHGAHEP